MYEDPEHILLALYFATREKDKDGYFHYKPFPSRNHMYIEAYVYAFQRDFCHIYEYQKGDFMPYSKKVESNFQYFNYNPIMDHYEVKDEHLGDEFMTWLQKNDKYKQELVDLRTRCDIFQEKELYLVMYEHMKEYIGNIKNTNVFPSKLYTEVSKTLHGLEFDYFRPLLTQEKSERIKNNFEKLIWAKSV